ncbi:type II toxin-antitoxin system RelE/ParE family toxin [Parabacteroides sp. OttesenSCG-928-G06]|nr:type II toxin-antitoxin system RelE/ParE family toxin [Parabacteroides sp. OttesenSCG-928-G06]
MVVRWTPEAWMQLKDIYKYYLNVAGLRTAEEVRKEIRDTANKLARFPLLGPTEENVNLENSHNYRSLVVNKNYKIIYQIDDEQVFIMAIWDTRQNPLKLENILDK